MAEKKITLPVNISVQMLMYDISNKTFLVGRATESADAGSYESAANMRVSEDNEDSAEIRRSINNSFKAVKGMFGEYLDESKTSTNNLIDTAIENDGVLTLSFKLPSNYNGASADSLGAGIHAYIVCMACYDWFSITNKSVADDYMTRASASLENAKRALYRRTRPTAPTITTISEDGKAS